MRLLKTSTLEVEDFPYGRIPKYAILSHRWGTYELTLQDVKGRIWEKAGFGNDKSQIKAFEKVEQCCFKAKADLYEYVWIDSCCIDKTSSAELSEAINSMYLWYYKAEVCYAYLADVPSIAPFESSQWFTRGWTLQELLAPDEIYFLDEDWKDLGTKKTLQQAISRRTRIPVGILSGGDIGTASIAQRMSWASDRETTRIEDRAYCLMGVFGINMPLLYGEGERAFLRLQEEIMKISDDQSIFAWKSSDSRGGLLATSPQAFINSSNIIPSSPLGKRGSPPTVNSRGINLDIRFIARGSGGLGMVVLHCAERGREDKPLVIYVRDAALTMELFERVWSEHFEGLDVSRFRISQYPMRKICIHTGRLTPTGKHDVSVIWDRDRIMKQTYDDAKLASLMDSAPRWALFEAARNGLQDDVWLMLTRDDITASMRDEGGRTVLWYAVKYGQVALVKILLARSDVDAYDVDKAHRPPLFTAAAGGHEAVVKVLLESGAFIDAKDKSGWTPLWEATTHGHAAIFKLLLEGGADINAQDSYGRVLLQEAVEKGHEDVIKLLLENGADSNTQDRYGRSLLWDAVSNKRVAVIKLLLENGADINARDKDGRTLLWTAASNGHEAVAKVLLENGIDVNSDGELSNTPLYRAAMHGHEAVVKVLLENGVDTELKDGHNSSSLVIAALNGNEAIVNLLLDHGADIEFKSRNDYTPLLAAARGGSEVIVRLLLKNGANTESKDIDGYTPLIIAARFGLEVIVKLLLENGANIESKSIDGYTPASAAESEGHDAIMKVLLENGASTGEQESA